MKKRNERGLTLVELMAVIAVLAVLAVIVTPNIIGAIKKARSGSEDAQIDTILSAAKNWTADELDKKHCLLCIPDESQVRNEEYCNMYGGEWCLDLSVCLTTGNSACSDNRYSEKTRNVTIGELQNGYLDEDLKNPKTDQYYNVDSYVQITLNASTQQYEYEFVDIENE